MITVSKKEIKKMRSSLKKEEVLKKRTTQIWQKKGELAPDEELKMRRLHDQYLIVAHKNKSIHLTPKVVFGSPTVRERVFGTHNTLFIQGEYPVKLLRGVLECANIIEVRTDSDFIEKAMYYASRLSTVSALVVYSSRRLQDLIQTSIRVNGRGKPKFTDDLMLGDEYWSDAFFDT